MRFKKWSKSFDSYPCQFLMAFFTLSDWLFLSNTLNCTSIALASALVQGWQVGWFQCRRMASSFRTLSLLATNFEKISTPAQLTLPGCGCGVGMYVETNCTNEIMFINPWAQTKYFMIFLPNSTNYIQRCKYKTTIINSVLSLHVYPSALNLHRIDLLLLHFE